jgi:hypothetical protein
MVLLSGNVPEALVHASCHFCATPQIRLTARRKDLLILA